MKPHLPALALFVALTALMANPLVRDPAHTTVGWEGDNLSGVRIFWWMKHALVDLGRSPFFDPESVYPLGDERARSEMFPAASVLAIPITATFGPVVAYNTMMFLSFVLTGFGTYLWVHTMTGGRGPAVLAGIIAAFLPYRFAHLLGHADITGTQWMPWTLFALERFLSAKTARRAAGVGVALGLTMLSAWYYAYSTALMLPVYTLARTRPWREHWNAATLRGLAIAAGVAGAMIMPFLVPYLRLRMAGRLERSIEEMESHSLNVYSFFLPNWQSPLWHDFMAHWFRQDSVYGVERAVSLGYTACALGLVALALRRTDGRVAALVAVWLASYVMALGPTVHFGDRQVRIPTPLLVTAVAQNVAGMFPSAAGIRQQIIEDQSVPIPLPAMAMYFLTPISSAVRVMARFGFWTGLMTAALAAWGLMRVQHEVRRRFGERTRLAVVVLVAACTLVLVESYSQQPLTRVEPRAVDVWLRDLPRGDWSVVELPLAQTDRYVQDYYKTVHQKPTILTSPSDGFPSPLVMKRREALTVFPSTEALATLREARVRHVLFTPSAIPGWPAYKQKLDTVPELVFDRELDGVQVYLVR